MNAPRLAAGVAGVIAGVAAVAIARRSPEFSLVGDAPAASAAELLAGWSVLGAGLVAWTRRRTTGPPLAAAGIAWFVAEFNNPGAGSALVFTVGLLLFGVCPVLVAHAALSQLPGDRDRILIGCGHAAAIALGLVPALVFDPAAQGCGGCPENLVLLAGDPAAYRTLSHAGLALGIAWVVAVLVVVGLRFAHASPGLRRLAAPLLVPALAYLAVVAVSFANGLSGDPRLWRLEVVALVAMAAGVAWDHTRWRRRRGVLARLVVELGAAPPPGGLRDVLARQLDDPLLQLVYAHDGGWVDLQGRPAGAEHFTRLETGGRPVAAVLHRPGLLEEPGAVEELAAAARLALEHERLQAEICAQVAHLRASRARIVATGDAERRRLEGDLHDGAQQRLVTLALALQFAELSRDDRDQIAELGRARAEVLAALDALRDLAHGIHPMALTDGGVAAAAEALSERTARLTLGTLTEERFAPSLESAAYFVIVESLKRVGGARIVVDLQRDGVSLVLELQTDKPLRARLTDVEDRVGALDGRLAVEPGGGGTRIRAELPCG
jgi:signal transduction histidine kinase